MFILVKAKYFTKEIEKELEKKNFTPVFLHTLNYSNKTQARNEIDKIKQNITYRFNAIQIIIENLDNSTQQFINSLKQDFDLVVGVGGLNKVNRFFLEQTNIDFLQDPQNSQFTPKFDFIHHFNSGLNHVLCQIARENNINFLFSLNFTKNKRLISKETGRFIQNIKLARKYNINIYSNFIINHEYDIKTIKELDAINNLLKLSTKEIKTSEKILEKRIEENTKKQSFEYISENIEVLV